MLHKVFIISVFCFIKLLFIWLTVSRACFKSVFVYFIS